MLQWLAAGRLSALVGVMALMPAWSVPAFPQMSASIVGSVVDPTGQPVEGATVTCVYSGNVSRKFEAVTDARGRFAQLGLQAGSYTVTARKEGVGVESMEVTLRVGQRVTLDLKMRPEGARTLDELSAEERAEYERTATVNAALAAGVAASRAGDYAGAIARFGEALETVPDCHECHQNIGQVYAAQKDYANAEAAFKRALAIAPDYAPAYQELSAVYNAQRRFDEAAEASARAAELGGATAAGGNAEAIFNQGLINWNAGNIAEAKGQFEQTLALDPNHAEAHYWMGMAHVNEGQLAEAKAAFQRYVELDPTGRFAEQAKAMLTQLP